VTHLRKIMLEELQRRNLSKLTAECYLRVVEEFALFYNRPPDQLGPEQIRQYQAHLFTDRKLELFIVNSAAFACAGKGLLTIRVGTFVRVPGRILNSPR
jgi:hypothetical protein